METFNELLEKYTDKCGIAKWYSVPFNVAGKSAATNGWVLIATPSCGDFPDCGEKTKGVYPQTPNTDKLITIEAIKEALGKCPRVDSYDNTEKQCDACYGDGFVEWEFDHNYKTHYGEFECPVCEGSGVIGGKVKNGKTELDATKFVVIGNSTFNVKRIEELLYVAEKLNSDVRLVYQDRPNSHSMFKIGDVDMIIMPSMNDNPDNVICTIE